MAKSKGENLGASQLLEMFAPEKSCYLPHLIEEGWYKPQEMLQGAELCRIAKSGKSPLCLRGCENLVFSLKRELVRQLSIPQPQRAINAREEQNCYNTETELLKELKGMTGENKGTPAADAGTTVKNQTF